MMNIKWSVIGLLMMLTVSLQAEYQRNILVLHSYHQGLMWTDEISKGISQIFQDYPEYELEYHYLNARRTFDANYLKKQEEIILHDMACLDYQAIIVSDNSAFNFIKQMPDSVLGDIPIVCCGINGIAVEPFSDQCYIIHEDVDFADAFSMISRLMPELDTLVVINDRTLVGRLTKQELDAELQSFTCPFAVVYYDDYSLPQLKAMIPTLGANTAIYLLVFNQDSEGTYISYNYGLRTIVERSKVPIFGAWGFYMGKGIVGGKMTRGRHHGRLAARACVKLLKQGTLEEEDLQAVNRYMADYSVMKHYGMRMRALADDTVVINKPDHKLVVHSFYALILLFLLVLLGYRRNQKYLKRMVFKRTRELKLALRNKDQFFSLLAHDLRSPTGTLAQTLKYLDMHGHQLTEQRRALMLRELAKTSSRVYHLLEDLLVWGRFQFSSHYEAQLSTFELQPLVADVCEVYYLEKDKGLFKNEVPAFLALHNDSFVLKFILRNLISNAIKYSPDDGCITIGADVEDAKVSFWVKDEGQGMSPEVMQSILNRDPIQTQGAKGQKSFGLGLRSVQAYLEQINGELKVESSVGEGSCFYVHLR